MKLRLSFHGAQNIFFVAVVVRAFSIKHSSIAIHEPGALFNGCSNK
jgi:hypothetical protein